MLNGSKSQQTGDMKSGRVECITVATTIITEVNVHIMHSMTAPGHSPTLQGNMKLTYCSPFLPIECFVYSF